LFCHGKNHQPDACPVNDNGSFGIRETTLNVVCCNRERSSAFRFRGQFDSKVGRDGIIPAILG
jgi:hypothetical protein